MNERVRLSCKRLIGKPTCKKTENISYRSILSTRMRKVEVVTELMNLHGGVLVIKILKHAHPAVDVPIVQKDIIRRSIIYTSGQQ